jgi:small subunit ribosomal protein S6
MREYEIMWIVAPTETEEGVQAIVAQYEEVLTSQGAKMIDTEIWGRRRLAYPIKKFREGVYILFHVNAESDAVNELERRFKMAENVIRHLTVRMDADMKRARKREAERAAKRRAKGIEEPPKDAPEDTSDQAAAEPAEAKVADSAGEKQEAEAEVKAEAGEQTTSGEDTEAESAAESEGEKS